jgi:hypothetical protein
MSNQLPYLIVITSANCGACRSLHTSGNFNRGDEKPTKKYMRDILWNATSLWKLITANPEPSFKSPARYIAMEYEFIDMQGRSVENIKSFTIFSFQVVEDDGEKDVEVSRNIYDRVIKLENNIPKYTDEYTYTKDDGEEISNDPMKGSFNELLSKTFPKMLSKYCVQYPSMILVSNAELKKALANPAYSPYARSYSLIIGKNTEGLWAPIAHDKGKEAWKNGFITYAQHAVETPDFLVPPSIEEPLPIDEKKNPAEQKKSVTMATTSNPVKLTQQKSILKGSNKIETSTEISSKNTIVNGSSTCTPYRIKIVPLSSKYSFE